MNEQQLMSNQGIYRWKGEKMRSSLIGTKLGAIVLTNQRLIFLSTGGNDVLKRAATVGAGGVASTAATDQLDLSALGNEGSLSIPLQTITEYGWKKRMFSNFLWVKHSDPVEGNKAWAFSTQYGFPSGPEWESAIGAARQAATAS